MLDLRLDESLECMGEAWTKLSGEELFQRSYVCRIQVEESETSVVLTKNEREAKCGFNKERWAFLV